MLMTRRAPTTASAGVQAAFASARVDQGLGVGAGVRFQTVTS